MFTDLFLRKLRSLRGYTPYVMNFGFIRFLQGVDTSYCRMLAVWWGISLGQKAEFCGIPIFRKHPTGIITIGSYSVFRSAEWSNTIGVNRRCIVAASRGARIQIGDRCGFTGTVIVAANSIIIGNRVLCGANCLIADSDRHPVDAVARSTNQPAKSMPVVVEDDVWLGMNVLVLKGCRIGKGSVVAANSVVTHSLPAGVIAGGVPARVIRELEYSS